MRSAFFGVEPRVAGMDVSSRENNFKPELIGRVLKNVVEQLRKNAVFEEDEIAKAWNKAVGKKIKLHTKPTRLTGTSLMVNVESSSWLFELQTKHKSEILKKLKSYLGENRVKDVKFKIGETQDAA